MTFFEHLDLICRKHPKDRLELPMVNGEVFLGSILHLGADCLELQAADHVQTVIIPLDKIVAIVMPRNDPKARGGNK